MKPRPHIRKTIKYGGAALTVLLLAAWITSGWYSFGYIRLTTWGGWSAGFASGQLCYSYQQKGGWAPPIPGWVAQREQGVRFDWLPFIDLNGPRWGGFAYVPLWIPLLPCLGLTALAFRLDSLARHRDRMHLCAKCHYDRTGLAPNAKCPECGTPSAREHSAEKTATDDTDAHG